MKLRKERKKETKTREITPSAHASPSDIHVQDLMHEGPTERAKSLIDVDVVDYLDGARSAEAGVSTRQDQHRLGRDQTNDA